MSEETAQEDQVHPDPGIGPEAQDVAIGSIALAGVILSLIVIAADAAFKILTSPLP